MCRWIAYRGETVALERYVTEPAHSLVVQSLKAKESVGATNGDGFGLGWYGDRDEPGLYREIRPAWSDENLKHLCRHIRSPMFFAHVRAATGTPTNRPNCHPALADGQNLYAFRYSYGGSANTLYYRETGHSVVVVSEPLDMDREFWKPVPPGHLITSRPGEPVLLEPFPEITRLAAE